MMHASVASFLTAALQYRTEASQPVPAHCLWISQVNGEGQTRYLAFQRSYPALISVDGAEHGYRVESPTEALTFAAEAAKSGLYFNDTGPDILPDLSRVTAERAPDAPASTVPIGRTRSV